MTWEEFQALPIGSVFKMNRKYGYGGRFVKQAGPRWDYGFASYPEAVLKPYVEDNAVELVSELELLAELGDVKW